MHSQKHPMNVRIGNFGFLWYSMVSKRRTVTPLTWHPNELRDPKKQWDSRIKSLRFRLTDLVLFVYRWLTFSYWSSYLTSLWFCFLTHERRLVLECRKPVIFVNWKNLLESFVFSNLLIMGESTGVGEKEKDSSASPTV